MEDKVDIVVRLKLLLRATRAGRDIADMVLNEKQDMVTILFENGCRKEANIAGDSGIAIIKDVISNL